MCNYIFDLDYTLYSPSDVDETNTILYYQSFEKKPFLNNLLRSLRGDKYIFSNGNAEHVKHVIEKMKLKNIFKNTANVDEFSVLKPHIQSYHYVMDKFNIDEGDFTIFFEDTLENLKTAKNIGWRTVYINDNYIDKVDYVDFCFPTIEKALLFFINNPIESY